MLTSGARRRWAAAAVVAVALAAGGCGGQAPSVPAPATTTAGTAPTTMAGGAPDPTPVGVDPVWGAPVFVEDFTGSSLDSAEWLIYHSPQAPQHPRVREAARVVDGELRLTERFYPSAGRYASGGVMSTRDMMHGRWVARFRVEAGLGSNAVVLLWPASERWPADGEIDGIEVVGGDRQYAVANIHNGEEHLISGWELFADFTQWHTVTIEWLPDSVSLYLDDELFLRETRAQYIPKTSLMHLTLQLDAGCDHYIPCRDAASPDEVTMAIDWVRIYAAP